MRYVVLTPEEREYAVSVAKLRRRSSQDMGLQNGVGFDERKAMRYEVMGACGEIAVCRAFNVKPVIRDGDFKNRPDLIIFGYPVEVRATGSRTPKLYFRAGDDPESAYFLVSEIEEQRTYAVHGWSVPSEDKSRYHLDGAPGRPKSPCIDAADLRHECWFRVWVERRNRNASVPGILCHVQR